MIAYKGFQKGLTCRGYQFKVGMNVTDKANCVANGFHCAENPLDCLTYYPNWDTSEYWQVEAGGDLDEDGTDSKISCTELNLVKRLGFCEFVLAAAKYYVVHPTRYFNRIGKVNVKIDIGTAESGCAVIVKGYSPVAEGKEGSILVLLQENAEGKNVEARWTTIDRKEAEGMYTISEGKVIRI